jgi:hypothetical protein
MEKRGEWLCVEWRNLVGTEVILFETIGVLANTVQGLYFSPYLHRGSTVWGKSNPVIQAW